MATNALLIGERTFPFHAIDEKGDELVDAVGDAADVEITTDRDALESLDDYDVLIDYMTDSELTTEQIDGLVSFVRNGGAYVGVHCAADLTSTVPSDPEDVVDTRPEPDPRHRSLLGGEFLDHPAQSEFHVEAVSDHPVTAGVDSFDVYDEPYQVDVDATVDVLARMEHSELKNYPVAWVRTDGDGRVCYISLGHTDESLRSSGFRQLLRNAITWATDG
ncbi:ThuA domain-containing protein [Natrialba swarupiae]|uniref:ThuA domain-containing protein n=1 Tax=Natrialba swarupiae TaxID=2448032 RepID=A0A5D5AKK3_9EURY|nr:ThuA domain-containing protein [Natrialba swarupiae]TYT61493.1 ThuA domain-containing protein [Natrialba swarupiae]